LSFAEQLALNDRFMYRSQAAFAKKTRKDIEILSFIPRARRDPNQPFWRFWDRNYGYQWEMREIGTGNCYWVGLIEDALIVDSID
jgi:hypothetical protein